MENLLLHNWFAALPADVYTRIVANVFSGIPCPEEILIEWFAGAPISLYTKCAIEHAAALEGHPFEFGELNVFVLKQVILTSIDMVEACFPGISPDDMMAQIAPIIANAEMMLSQPQHPTLMDIDASNHISII